MISFRHKGDFKKTEMFLKGNVDKDHIDILNLYGKKGVDALAANTPVDTGKTSRSWSYKIVKEKESTKLVWINTNVVKGIPIAIILQYGHGTRNGAYVQGVDYINPALKPIFDQIASDVWKEVTKG